MSAPELSVLIVDDEPPARERLERLVAELPGWRVAGLCATGTEALQRVGEFAPDVVLLDIRMPGIGGIETARHLGALEAPPAVVFTTAYDQYALEAFDSQAIGYLLKPIRRERLADALRHASRLRPLQLRALAGAEPKRQARQQIAVRARNGLRLIPVGQIAFFRAEQKYVTVRHPAGESLIDESLKQLEEEFADDFVRVHRGYLIAVAHVAVLQRDPRGRYSLRMRGLETAVPVSRRQLAELRKRLGSRQR